MEKSLNQVELFNTATRSVEIFQTLEQGKAKVYCCGPTVYNYQHVGNLRTYIFEDLLVRTLRRAGYDVTHVMNITDVGHLVSDADDGDDKMLLAVKREGKTSAEIAQYYTDIFFAHCKLVNIKTPDVVCKATEHIAQMISLIETLIEKDFAYLAGGNVYFDVSKFNRYGDLAKLDLENLQAGARIEVDSQKRGPLDFVLWFTRSKFENQELQWESPWGRGYPGWHIECSAMAQEYLGEEIDIHCGGIDHIPVHHTNEIAQSECASGKCFARFWLHGGFLVTSGEKMSKSSGEFLTLDRLLERSIDPVAYRLFCLSGSYRKELRWSWDAIESAAKTLEKMKSAVASWGEVSGSAPLSADAELRLKEFNKAVFNDLGMPKALATLHAVISDSALSAEEKYSLLLDFDEILGLGIASWPQSNKLELPEEVTALIEQRLAARADKNWAASDQLRDRILELGFEVLDTKDGQKISKRKV